MARKKTVPPIDFDKAVQEVLNQYGTEVNEVMDDAIAKVADGAVEKLKAVKSFAPDGNPSGEYSASWESEERRTGRLSKKHVIHNAEHYRLTHLLEKGHVSRNGSDRTFGQVRAYPHIKDVNDWVGEELPKEIERKLK